jgi:hypothetical protein
MCNCWRDEVLKAATLEYYLMGWEMWTGIVSLPTFKRNTPPPCSGSHSKPCKQQAQYFHPEDGNSSFLLHICILLSDYMASHPTRHCDSNINLALHKTISNYNMYICVLMIHTLFIYVYIVLCNIHMIYIFYIMPKGNMFYIPLTSLI